MVPGPCVVADNATPFPDDLGAAIEASPRDRRTFNTLGRYNLVAPAFRTNNMKTLAGRARKIAAGRLRRGAA